MRYYRYGGLISYYFNSLDFMNTFIVEFIMPTSQIDEWMKVPEDQRKIEEQKMNDAWGVWMGAHGSMVKETQMVGKVKRVSASGVEDTRNDLMMYSIVEAESAEAIAEAYKDHPHLTMPHASLEIMSIKSM